MGHRSQASLSEFQSLNKASTRSSFPCSRWKTSFPFWCSWAQHWDMGESQGITSEPWGDVIIQDNSKNYVKPRQSQEHLPPQNAPCSNLQYLSCKSNYQDFLLRVRGRAESSTSGLWKAANVRIKMCFRFLSWHFVKWTERSKCRTLKEMLESWARKAHQMSPFKFYISKAEGKKKKYLVKTSTCCSAQRAKDRGQLQDLCGMSLCRKTGHEHWSPPPENSQQE